MLKFSVFLICFFLYSSSFAFESSTEKHLSHSSEKLINAKEEFKDLVIGDVNAPITIVDYSSFSCVGCQYFYNQVILGIKEEYIDSGRVKLILRNFPLDNVSFKASLLLKYYENKVPVDGNNYNNILNIISKLFSISIRFKDLSEFDSSLYQVAKHDMQLSKDEFRTAINDSKLKKQILNEKLYAIKELKLRGTPTIYMNNKKFMKSLTLKNLQDSIKEALDGLAKPV